MFIHNFKYSLKTLFKNKSLVFWTYAFPIILGTFFNMAFSNIEESEKLDIIDIAIVSNSEFNDNEVFKKSFEQLSDSNSDKRLFDIRYVSLDEAYALLDDNEITGYLTFGDEVKVVVNKSGINETILKYVTEEIIETDEIIRRVVDKKIQEGFKNSSLEMNNLNNIGEKVYNDVILMLKESKVNIKNISNNNLSYTMIEFYTLIAMTCLYGGIIGMVSVNRNLANMSSNGKRVAVSPISKSSLIISSVLASLIISLIGIFILLIYTIFILKVDYGENLSLVSLLTFVGSVSGLTFGIAIATLFKTNDSVKTGIVISITMLGCFLSGMMGITMKYIVDKNIPIINKINPASMITDGFYSLYYYDTLDRFYFDILSLIIFSLIMISISMFSLRRQKYDSI